MFEGVQHLFHDLGIFFAFIGNNLTDILGVIITPFQSIASFVSGFVQSAFSSPSGAESISFPTEVISVLESIPLFGHLTFMIGIGIIFIIGFSLFKLLKVFII